MFKDVLSIGGKPGLFRMVSHAKNYIIVESLIDGKKIEIDIKNNAQLQEFFAKVFPDFDRDRIYPNDIKKFISWYNILINKQITDFDIDSEETENTEETK